MKGVEFYIFNAELWYRRGTENRRFSETDTDIVDLLVNRIYNDYPTAYKALNKEYSKFADDPAYMRFRMVSRFCKCNFGCIDNILDIDSTERIKFECVSCPLRGECKYEGKICNPPYNTNVSVAEERVVRLWLRNLSEDDIAEQLCLSPYTVHNHIHNAYSKLGVHTKAEFVQYCTEHNIFIND